MSDIAIRVENLSKLYRIGTREPYYTLRDTLMRMFSFPFHPFRRNGRFVSDPEENQIWALTDVSFEVKRGEAVGIIGRNGVGKTTLLKILSRITEPTRGYAEIRGRVGSLLEVGTGFHPELTGRENIYLNGAILGMRKEEIDRKFDEIVAFAEVERFLDTPVKYYSTGMYMRLAFAVAAHLEPEILLVDEVLAVGDVAFQKKCLEKMRGVASEGLTILFVSHQLTAIRRLCSSCVWLHAGQVQMYGSVQDVVSSYQSAVSSQYGRFPSAGRDRRSTERARFVWWEVVSPRSNKPNILSSSGPCALKVALQVYTPIEKGHSGIAIWNDENQLIWAGEIEFPLDLVPGCYDFLYTFPGLPLKPGCYQIQISLYEPGQLIDNWYCVPELIIATQPASHPYDRWQGLLNLSFHCHVVRVE